MTGNGEGKAGRGCGASEPQITLMDADQHKPDGHARNSVLFFLHPRPSAKSAVPFLLKYPIVALDGSYQHSCSSCHSWFLVRNGQKINHESHERHESGRPNVWKSFTKTKPMRSSAHVFDVYLELSSFVLFVSFVVSRPQWPEDKPRITRTTRIREAECMEIVHKDEACAIRGACSLGLSGLGLSAFVFFVSFVVPRPQRPEDKPRITRTTRIREAEFLKIVCKDEAYAIMGAFSLRSIGLISVDQC